VELGYAIWSQPDGAAYQIFDQQAAPMVEGPYGAGGRPVTAHTWEELAGKLQLDPDALENTVAEYNGAVEDGVLNLNVKDGKGATGLNPPKSNWAMRLDQPPFVAYRVTTTILFSYGGLAVDPKARVLDGAYEPISGLFATGEAIGGLYYRHFSTGSGLMLGSVFGRIAGANAAKHAE
jgi:tricarballylate dehydrogenase